MLWAVSRDLRSKNDERCPSSGKGNISCCSRARTIRSLKAVHLPVYPRNGSYSPGSKQLRSENSSGGWQLIYVAEFERQLQERGGRQASGRTIRRRRPIELLTREWPAPKPHSKAQCFRAPSSLHRLHPETT